MLEIRRVLTLLVITAVYLLWRRAELSAQGPVGVTMPDARPGRPEPRG